VSNNKYKILLVEDEDNIRGFIQTIMEANSYQVIAAETGSQGSLLLSHQPDLIILDLGLPDMDGLDFIKSTRKTSAVPIIILSARSQEWDKVAALDLGANAARGQVCPGRSGDRLWEADGNDCRGRGTADADGI